METRLDQFEKMLKSIQDQYAECCEKMETLKAEGKEKTVSFKQLFATKLTLQNVLIIYKNYGLIDNF